MAHARTCSAVMLGVEGHLIEVEAHISAGLPAMSIVGLPDAAVGESRDRARSAVLNSGLTWPATRVTIGLSPAWLPKTGPGLDLAIAMAALAAADTVPRQSVAGTLIIGELSLDGRVRPVRGVLVAAAAAARGGLVRIIVPRANEAEAMLVPGVSALGVSSLAELVARLRGDEPPAALDHVEVPALPEEGAIGGPATLDLADVRGHHFARLGLELAAAGGHHLAMLGPPGVGKTLLAERLVGILPDLSDKEALEVTGVHSVAGQLPARVGLIRRPPLSAPHHTATFAALVGGGGGRSPRVGLVSLAHRGVLFLDEAPEFAPAVLDALRQPMESGEVTIARVGFAARLPARFQLVLAANPCPCGRANSPNSDDECTCSSLQRRRYLSRLSGPLLDRVDIRLVLERPTADELLLDGPRPEGSAAVAARVAQARARSAMRLRGTAWTTNAEVPGSELRRTHRPDPSGALALDTLARSPRSSARGLDRVARLAWTVADLRGHDRPDEQDVLTAQEARTGRGMWAA